MAKKRVKKIQPLGVKSPAQQTDGAYPVKPEDLDQQQERVRKAAVAGADALKSISPATKAIVPEVSPAPTALSLESGTAAPILPAGAAEKARTRTTSQKVRVTFVLLEPAARQVWVSGDFNDWSHDKAPMKRHDDGHWEASTELTPGRYEYKFIVDGEWIPDPLATEQVWNRHGTLNSVIQVQR